MSIKISCFILTMWYVNLTIGVGYRDGNQCFILTMWYVNWYFLKSSRAIPLGFILTMWYVNTVSIVDNNTFNCFILTMCFKGR